MSESNEQALREAFEVLIKKESKYLGLGLPPLDFFESSGKFISYNNTFVSSLYKYFSFGYKYAQASTPQPQTVRDALEKAANIAKKYHAGGVGSDFDGGMSHAAMSIEEEIRALIAPLSAADDSKNSNELREAAKAVVERWDSPKWKDLPHTAEYIHRLRDALDADSEKVNGFDKNQWWVKELERLWGTGEVTNDTRRAAKVACNFIDSVAVQEPEGWKLERTSDHIIKLTLKDGINWHFIKGERPNEQMGAFIYEFLNDMLAAAPTLDKEAKK